MKFKFSSFLSGFLAAGILFSVSALAISGRMTIEVDPINVQVNGEVFQPTDVNGKEVPVFAYQGTTYAPLRALAEAYGLEVGYDAAANMATVSDPDAKTPDTTTPDNTAKTDYSDWSAEDEAAYQEFKAILGTPMVSRVVWRFAVDTDALRMYADNTPKDKAYQYLKRLAAECFAQTTEWITNEHYIGVSICKENNNILVGVTQYSDKTILDADCIWDDFEFHIGQPTMDVEL